jgi:hypothetical protein
MTSEELDHARAELEALGADWTLLSAPENVTDVSHYEAPIDFGARSSQLWAGACTGGGAGGDGAAAGAGTGFMGAWRGRLLLGRLAGHTLPLPDDPGSRALDDARLIYKNSCSTTATPSSSLLKVIRSANSFNSGIALSMATPIRLSRIISMSLVSSPKAITWSRE